MDLSLLVEIIIISGLAGLLMGVIGGGGGGLYVIVLTFFLGLPVEVAIGTALALSAITALVAVLENWKNKNIDGNTALQLTTYGAVGTVGGAFLVQYLSPDLLKFLIVITFVLLGSLALIRTKQLDQDITLPVKRRLKLLLPVGFLMGVVGGAFGLSGSTPLSSFLVSFVNLSPARAVGTSLLVTLLTSVVGVLIYYQRQAIDFNILLILGVGCIVGAYLGAKITAHINRKMLAITLAVLTIIFGIYLAIHS